MSAQAASAYPVVAEFCNDTAADLCLYLEMLGEQVILSPGHQIELLARPSPNLLPLTIGLVDGGLQIHPRREFDPHWHVRFKGHVIRPAEPTRLSDFEDIEGDACATWPRRPAASAP